MTAGVRALVAAHRCGERAISDTIENVIYALDATPDPATWISRVPAEALRARAAQLQDGPTDLALFGVPFAVKDNIDVAGLPTTAACPDFAYVPRESAFVLRTLLQAGAVLVAKTNMDQFATGLVGTRTPHGACSSVFSREHISGGSSSGSAVAVAAGIVPFSLGTDTAGSGRVPAAFNGIVGLKPSIGRLSCRGVVPACRTLDCVSIFTRDVADAAAVLAAADCFDPEDPHARRAPAPRAGRYPSLIGVPRPEDLAQLDDGCQDAWQAARARAAQVADGVVEIDLAPFLAAARLLYEGPWIAERYAAVGAFLEREDVIADPIVRAIVLGGATASAADLFRGMYRLAELRRAAEAVWEQVDALLLPTTPIHPTHVAVAADPIGVNARLGRWTNFVNLLDLAAVAVPAAPHENGLPFGVSLVAPAWGEPSVLRLAAAFESAAEPQFDIAVAGAHLSGMKRNHELLERGARLVRCTRTAPCYRLFAIADGSGRPGLLRDAEHGDAIEVEVWRMGAAALGTFTASVAAPLAIGTLELEDGSTVHGFLCEPHALHDAKEATSFGGWRGYLASAG